MRVFIDQSFFMQEQQRWLKFEYFTWRKHKKSRAFDFVWLTCTTDYDVLLYSYSQNETCYHNYEARAMLLGAGYGGQGIKMADMDICFVTSHENNPQ